MRRTAMGTEQALEAEAERITKQDMSAAIAKVKKIMSTFGLTIEHLQTTVTATKPNAAKKVKPKRAGGGVAKYADPKRVGSFAC
jgi:hypothetical protein